MVDDKITVVCGGQQWWMTRLQWLVADDKITVVYDKITVVGGIQWWMSRLQWLITRLQWLIRRLQWLVADYSDG